ncbi:MAG: response regulator [Desulfobacterales bacterium]
MEDNEQVKNLAFEILKRKGYAVLVADSGGEALTVMDRHEGPLHLLLTDVVMPGRNGTSLYAETIHKHPGLKVLYMSGYSDNFITLRGVLDGRSELIQKPFTVNALSAKVREVLDR